MTTTTPTEAGAAAYDANIPHEGHGLPTGHPDIDPWQAGWRARRDAVAQARYDRLVKQAEIIRITPTASTCLAGHEFMRSLFAMVSPGAQQMRER